MIGNPAHVRMLSGLEIPLVGDYSLNLTNSFTAAALHNLGLKGATLSPELSTEEMKAIKGSGLSLEAIIYGRVPVMVTEHCPIGGKEPNANESSCQLCQMGKYDLQDRTGAEFPVLGDQESCRCTILDAKKQRRTFRGGRNGAGEITGFRINCYDETVEELRRIIEKRLR